MVRWGGGRSGKMIRDGGTDQEWGEKRRCRFLGLVEERGWREIKCGMVGIGMIVYVRIGKMGSYGKQ
jgi:hypothetical protein